jgi:hypothetical protein
MPKYEIKPFGNSYGIWDNKLKEWHGVGYNSYQGAETALAYLINMTIFLGD